MHVRTPPPLTSQELERLWRWEHRIVRFYVVAIPLLIVAMAVALVYSDVVWLRRSLLGLAVLLIVAASFVQLSERCPRCRAKLRPKSLLRLPDHCPMCGVAFERPPAPDAQGPKT